MTKTSQQIAEELAMKAAEAVLPDDMDREGQIRRQEHLPYQLILQSIPLVELVELLNYLPEIEDFYPVNQEVEDLRIKINTKLKQLGIEI